MITIVSADTLLIKTNVQFVEEEKLDHEFFLKEQIDKAIFTTTRKAFYRFTVRSVEEESLKAHAPIVPNERKSDSPTVVIRVATRHTARTSMSLIMFIFLDIAGI